MIIRLVRQPEPILDFWEPYVKLCRGGGWGAETHLSVFEIIFESKGAPGVSRALHSLRILRIGRIGSEGSGRNVGSWNFQLYSCCRAVYAGFNTQRGVYTSTILYFPLDLQFTTAQACFCKDVYHVFYKKLLIYLRFTWRQDMKKLC